MPDVVTFDAPNRIITEIANGAVNSLDIVEVYSEWKVWAAQSDNLKFPPAFSVVGGDPISPSQSLGSTFFLENGWRIRPAELNHELEIRGNLFVAGGVGNVFVPTLGSFNVSTKLSVSNLVDAVNTFQQADRSQLNFVHLWASGRLRIDPAAKQMILYEADNTTVHATWDIEVQGGGTWNVPTGVQVDRTPA